jgi:hypothetical protein
MATELFDEKIVKKRGLTKIELQCWVEIAELNQMEYNRTISKFTKDIKSTIYDLRNKNSDNYEYFVDIDIRNSPSKTAFLSLQVSLFKDNNVIQLKDYPNVLKDFIENYHCFQVFQNRKKRKI